MTTTLDVVLNYRVNQVASLGSDIFLLRDDSHGTRFLWLFPQNRALQITGMEKLVFMVPCYSMHCLYLCLQSKLNMELTIWKLIKEETGTFTATRWLNEASIPGYKSSIYGYYRMSIASNGDVLFYWSRPNSKLSMMVVFNSNGVAIRQLSESVEVGVTVLERLLKPNGHIIHVYDRIVKSTDEVAELNKDYEIDKHFKFSNKISKCLLDKYERIIAFNNLGGVQCLDSEFNVLDHCIPNSYIGKLIRLCAACYDSDRHEIFCRSVRDYEHVRLYAFKLTD